MSPEVICGRPVVSPRSFLQVMLYFQVRGHYYIGINKPGTGARWRRTTGQEVYSPLVLAFAHEVGIECISFLWSMLKALPEQKMMTPQKMEDWTGSHVTRATILDSSYSLPQNVALITLQVIEFYLKYSPSLWD